MAYIRLPHPFAIRRNSRDVRSRDGRSFAALVFLLVAELAIAFDANDGYAPGLNGVVHALTVQPSGHAIVGGAFSAVNGVSCAQLCRLNNDGRVAAGFGPTQLDGAVRALLQRPDGKVLVGGEFTAGFGRLRARLVQLNADGSVDEAGTGAGVNGPVFALAQQPDGRVLIGGDFTQIGSNWPSAKLARRLANGSVDQSFLATFNGPVLALAVLPNGNIVVGGAFTEFGGIPRSNLVVLSPTGQLRSPATFSANGAVRSLVSDVDGTVVIAGDFTVIGSVPRARLARMTPDGELIYGLANAENGVRALLFHSDGQLILGGDFLAINNQPRARLARLDPDRQLDAMWRTGTNGSVSALAEQPDGSVLVGGSFAQADGEVRSRLMRVTMHAVLERALTVGAESGGAVLSSASQADGGLMVGGSFITFGGQPREGIARVSANGQIDLGFNPTVGGGDVRMLVALDDGAVLLAGSFTSVNGNPRRGLAKLLANASLDNSFITPIFSNFGGPSFPAEVSGVYPAQRGRLYVTGNFDTVNTLPIEGIVRLRASNGSIEGSLSAKVQPGVTSLIEAADRSLLIVGGSTVNDIPQPARLSRLLPPDGSLDTSFVPQVGAGNEVTHVALLPDGKMIVALRQAPATSTFLRRLRADGSMDSDFAAFANGSVTSIAVRTDGVIAIAGDFNTVFGVARSGYALLGPTGILLNALPAANGTVTGARFQTDGKLILTGSFNSIGGQTRRGLARLSTPDAARYALQVDALTVRWLRAGAAPELSAPPRLWSSTFGQPLEPQEVFHRVPGGWQIDAAEQLGVSGYLRMQPRSIEQAADGSSAVEREFQILNTLLFKDGFEPGDPN